MTVVSRVRRQIVRVIDACGEALIEKQEFEPRIRSARERLAKLQANVQSQAEQKAQHRGGHLVIGDLEAFAEKVQVGLEQADRSMRRQVLQSLVERIEVSGHQVRVVYRVNCFPRPAGASPTSGQDCWRRRDATRAPTAGHTLQGRTASRRPPSFPTPRLPCRHAPMR